MMERKRAALLAAASALAGAAVGGSGTAATVSADLARVGVIAPPRPADDRTGLALYLPFGTGQGSAVADASGNGHSGTAANCAWTNAGRFAGGAMSFNGADSSIALPSAPNFPAWGIYSVSVWFRHDGGGYHGGYQYGHKIIDKTSMMHDWIINLCPHASPQGYVSFFAYEGGNARVMWDSSGKNYMDNAWHHVAVVRDGADGQLWVDGALKDSISDMIPVNSASALCVGNSFSADPAQRVSWSGLIDEVRVYGRALSPAEIGKLREEGLLALSAPGAPVTVAGGLAVSGGLTVAGAATFRGGARCLQPSGNLPGGSHTGAP
jgi:hypothetical protein